ncbi:paraquat-inducible protein A [Frateuria defendens]|uniref:paraquat-inducible protein A n=1 Tax=Frateuria defendens TaxID=2219559 RepID=UPI00066FEB84|nr:paraquat-inducible protein A [Frateuria defendens]
MTITASPMLICEHCDTVHRRRPLARGEVARCLRCGAVLERHQRFGVDGLLALVLAAMIVFVLANAWPIVTLGLNGQQVAARLWGVILTMWHDHSQVVAVLAAATLFFFPICKLLLLGWVLLCIRLGRIGEGFRRAMVLLHYVAPWTMSEVFVLGALVSIVKAHLYFDVTAEPGIYAYAALMVFITLFSGVDLHQLWDRAAERAA